MIESFELVCMLIVLIILNIVIVNLYKYNKYFPGIFMIINIIYGISIIAENEIFVMLLLVFSTMYNIFLLEYHLKLNKKG